MRDFIERIENELPGSFVVADMEAGLEHLKRGTLEHADTLLVVVEPYFKSLETGRRMAVTKKPGWVSVLAPVSNSLGDIVGVVEVASQRSLNPHDNVK